MRDSPPPSADVTTAEALALLARVLMGRVMFTSRALPTVRPVRHIVDDDQVVIGTDDAADLVDIPKRARMRVVAFQADQINLASGTGWTVTIVGDTDLVTDPDEIRRYRRLLQPWAAGQADYLIRIRPDMITGFRIAPGGDAAFTGREGGAPL